MIRFEKKMYLVDAEQPVTAGFLAILMPRTVDLVEMTVGIPVCVILVMLICNSIRVTRFAQGLLFEI